RGASHPPSWQSAGPHSWRNRVYINVSLVLLRSGHQSNNLGDELTAFGFGDVITISRISPITCASLGSAYPSAAATSSAIRTTSTLNDRAATGRRSEERRVGKECRS